MSNNLNKTGIFDLERENAQLHADLADSSAQLVLDEVEIQLLRSELEKARKRVDSAKPLIYRSIVVLQESGYPHEEESEWLAEEN